MLCSCWSGWNQFTISTHLSLCLHADVPFQQAVCVCDLYLHTGFFFFFFFFLSLFIEVFSERRPIMLFFCNQEGPLCQCRARRRTFFLSFMLNVDEVNPFQANRWTVEGLNVAQGPNGGSLAVVRFYNRPITSCSTLMWSVTSHWQGFGEYGNAKATIQTHRGRMFPVAE